MNALQIEPTTFRTWLRILARLPKAVLWLLRFPDLGETHLRQTATLWAGQEVATSEGAWAARELVVKDEDEYEEVAVRLASGCRYDGHRPRGRLAELRKTIYEGRFDAPLFDTGRWVRDLEDAYERAWEKWVRGEGGDIWLNDGR